jgi:hypothetical protein
MPFRRCQCHFGHVQVLLAIARNTLGACWLSTSASSCFPMSSRTLPVSGARDLLSPPYQRAVRVQNPRALLNCGNTLCDQAVNHRGPSSSAKHWRHNHSCAHLSINYEQPLPRRRHDAARLRIVTTCEKQVLY